MGRERYDDEGRGLRRPRTVQARVGYVRSLSGDGPAFEQGWVECPRDVSAMPIERCLTCGECASVAIDREAHIESLRCFRPELHERPRERRRGLLAEVPAVAAVMTRDVLCVQPDVSLDAVMSLFGQHGFKAFPVVAADGALLGVVAESDVLDYLHARAETGERSDRRSGGPDEAAMHEPGMHELSDVPLVSDVMMPLALSVHEDAPLTQAAALMAFERVHRLVVQRPDGQVVGLLSATDVLQWLGDAGGC